MRSRTVLQTIGRDERKPGAWKHAHCVMTRTGAEITARVPRASRRRPRTRERTARRDAPCLQPLTASGTPIPSSADIARVFDGFPRGTVLALPILRWQIGHKEGSMIRTTAILTALLSLAGVNRLYAQETTPGPGTIEVTVIPGGATYFTGGNGGPSFGNYNLGGGLTYNI